LAIAVSIMSAGLVVALGGVLSTRQADALAALALSLAVISLLLQVIVYVAQARTTADASTLMAEIRSGVGTMRSQLDLQFKTVLERALERGAVVEAKEREDSSAPQSAVLDAIRQTVESALGSRVEQPRIAHPITTPNVEPEVLPTPVRDLLIYPQDAKQGEVALEALKTLTQGARRRLKRFGDDEIRSRLTNLPVGLWDSGETPKSVVELLKAGLVEERPIPIGYPKAKAWRSLTDPGRKAARLLTAAGDPPVNLKNAGLQELRNVGQ